MTPPSLQEGTCPATGDRHDLLILGGGIAGCAAAITAARHGISVAILAPLTPTPALGESLDWETPRLLRALGIDLEVLVSQDLATHKDGAVSSHAITGERLEIGFARGYRALMTLVGRDRRTYHVARSALDAALRARCAQLGVTWVDARARHIALHPHGQIQHVLDEHGHTHTASFFLGATGRARVLANAIHAQYNEVGPRKVAISATLEHTYDGMGTRIRLDDQHTPVWIWDIHTGSRRTNLGAVFVAEEVRGARRDGVSIEELFRAACTRHPDLDWLEGRELAHLEVCSFQAQEVSSAVGENWALVGEEACVIDPILSSGVTFGLRTGQSAGRGVVRLSQRGRRDTLERSMTLALSHARCANRLLDDLWYRSRTRLRWGLRFNVLMILTLNFNLNHLMARGWSHTAPGAWVLSRLHRLSTWWTGRIAGAQAPRLRRREIR